MLKCFESALLNTWGPHDLSQVRFSSHSPQRSQRVLHLQPRYPHAPSFLILQSLDANRMPVLIVLSSPSECWWLTTLMGNGQEWSSKGNFHSRILQSPMITGYDGLTAKHEETGLLPLYTPPAPCYSWFWAPKPLSLQIPLSQLTGQGAGYLEVDGKKWKLSTRGCINHTGSLQCSLQVVVEVLPKP